MESELGDAIAEALDDFGPDFDEEGNPLEEGESDRIKDEEERKKKDSPKASQNGSDDDDDDDDDDSGESGDEEREEAGATA